MYERIRELRRDNDLSQADLAKYLSCTQVCYSNYELGKREIPTSVLIQLAKFYNTSTDYLLDLTNRRQSEIEPEGPSLWLDLWQRDGGVGSIFFTGDGWISQRSCIGRR